MLPEEEKRLLKKAKGGDDASFEKLITDCTVSGIKDIQYHFKQRVF